MSTRTFLSKKVGGWKAETITTMVIWLIAVLITGTVVGDILVAVSILPAILAVISNLKGTLEKSRSEILRKRGLESFGLAFVLFIFLALSNGLGDEPVRQIMRAIGPLSGFLLLSLVLSGVICLIRSSKSAERVVKEKEKKLPTFPTKEKAASAFHRSKRLRTWLLDNHFKLEILSALVVAVLFGSWYLIRQQNFQMRMEQEKEAVSLNSDCQKLASEKKREVLSDTSIQGGVFETFQFSFNTTINGCILAYDYSGFIDVPAFLNDGEDGSEAYERMQISNLTTGEILFTKNETPPMDNIQQDRDEFHTLQNKYIASTKSF